jgi:hypothetical protein
MVIEAEIEAMAYHGHEAYSTMKSPMIEPIMTVK